VVKIFLGIKDIMQRLLRNRILFIIKIFITTIILFIIFRKIDFTKVFQNYYRIDLLTIFIIIVTALLKLYLQYINWGKYLQLNPDYKPQKNEILRTLFIGDALRFLIPGGYGVFGKMFFINNEKKASFLSIGIEKFLQIWTSLLFASFAAIYYFQTLKLIIKIFVFCLILISPFIINFFSHLIKRKKVKIFINEYIKIIPNIVFRQIAFMFLTLIQYFVLILCFKNIMFFHIIISVPLILSANIIPITYAGLGLRETFAVEILSKYNISGEIAVFCSLMIFLINTFLPALVGVYFILRSRHIRKSS